MKTDSNATPPANPHATTRDLRWLAAAGAAGSAFAVIATASAQGGLVQISQSGNTLRSTGPDAGFSFDLTGDGVGDLGPGANTTYTHPIQFDQRRARLNAGTTGGFARAFYDLNCIYFAPFGSICVPGGRVEIAGAIGGGLSPTNQFSASRTGLVRTTFTPDGVNGPFSLQPSITGLVEITAISDGASGGTRTISINRLIFDLDDPTGSALPTGGIAPSYSVFDPAVAVAVAVPEPSGVSIFALGAAGILAHRRRKRQAA